MPTATPFKALGAGNGLPSCLSKRNVSSDGKWTTLGGYNKDHAASRDPTPGEISLSQINAMKVFWNANGFSGEYTEQYEPTQVTSVTLDLDAGDYDYSEWYKSFSQSDDNVNKEPKDRVCYRNWIAGKWDSDENSDGSSGNNVLDEITMSSIPYRMYDGVTTDEDNFVGYGGGQFKLVADALSSQYMWICSSLNNSYSSSDGDLEYVTFSGIPYVAYLVDGLLPPDTEGVTYSISTTGNSIVGEVEDSGTVSIKLTIDPIDFYAY